MTADAIEQQACLKQLRLQGKQNLNFRLPFHGPADRAAGSSPACLAGAGPCQVIKYGTLRCESDSGSDQESLADSLAGSALDPQVPSPAASDNDPGDQYHVSISVSMLCNFDQY